jgi:hypothetical protein
MGPQWYFSCEELASYMKLAVRKAWDTREIGMKVEAFAIAGCDALSMYFNGNPISSVLTLQRFVQQL